MQKEDFVLLIMNCERYRHKAEAQRAGWLQQVSFPYFHVIGKEDLETPFLFEGNKLYVKTPDDYCGLPKKVIAAFEAVHQTFEYKYIFKTDDDQRLTDPEFFGRLIPSLLENTEKIHYGGRICEITGECISGYWEYHDELPRDILLRVNRYCNGRFYVLSNLAITDLVTKRGEIDKDYFEDYAIGYYLAPEFKSDIFVIDNEVFKDF
jgi:hypothetical protein